MTEYTHRIRYSETDRTGHLSMQGLLRLFQDMNYLGAEDAGRGIAYQEAHGAAWYLLGWDIHVCKMPQLSEVVIFRSRFYQLAGALAKKYMTLTSADGVVLAYALTNWAYVDKSSGAVRPFPDGYWEGEEITPLPNGLCDMKRPRMHAGMVPLTPITIGEGLIDENGHVNNVRFTELALSLMGYETGAVALRATFIRQTRLGDMLTPMRGGDTAAPLLAFLGDDGETNAVFSAS